MQLGNSPPPITSPAWSDRTKRTVVLVAVVGLTLVAIRLQDMLPLLLVAVVLAYLLTPLMHFIERRLLGHGPFREVPPRGLAILLSILVVIAFFIIVALVVLPVVINQFEAFASSIPNILVTAASGLERALDQPLTLNGEPILIDGLPFVPLDRIEEITGSRDLTSAISEFDLVAAVQSLVGSLPNLGGQAVSVVGGVLSALINIVLLFTMVFYLMKDGSKFADRAVMVTPYTYRNDVRRLLYELRKVWDAYLRGQLILCFVIGGAVFVIATILGLPNPLFLGLLAGVLEFLPGIGLGIALFPVLFLALFNDSNTLPFLEGGLGYAVVVGIAWSALQQFETIFLVPRIMGNQLNLHPFVVIVSVIAGANLLGLLGIVLAAPIVSSLRVVGQYAYGKLTDQNPFPTPRPKTAADRSRIVRWMLYWRRWLQDRLRRRVTVSTADVAVVDDDRFNG